MLGPSLTPRAPIGTSQLKMQRGGIRPGDGHHFLGRCLARSLVGQPPFRRRFDRQMAGFMEEVSWAQQFRLCEAGAPNFGGRCRLAAPLTIGRTPPKRTAERRPRTRRGVPASGPAPGQAQPASNHSRARLTSHALVGTGLFRTCDMNLSPERVRFGASSGRVCGGLEGGAPSQTENC